MDVYEKIREKLLQRPQQLFFVAKVKSVQNAVCTVDLDGLVLTDVQLRAVENGENSKLLVTPKTDSYVLMADLSNGNKTHFCVLSCSEVERVDIDVDSEIVFNGGIDGMVKIQALTDKLNALVDWCKNHTHGGVVTAVGGGGGALATGVIGNSGTPTVAPADFNKSDYEDANIKH